MNLCFPIIEDCGLESVAYGHFASAPNFLLVDTSNTACSVIPNQDPDHPFAGCNPFVALRGRKIDAIIADAIGDDSVQAMNLSGFKVYRAGSTLVEDNVKLFEKNELEEVLVAHSQLEGRCNAGGSGNGCNHHHH